MKPRYVHIGSLNIEHYGKDDDNSDNPFPLAEHIEMSGVHVLALQELYATNDITDLDKAPRNKYLDEVFTYIENHTGNAWEYEIFRNKFKDDDSQLCGIAWNTAHARKIGKTFRIPVSEEAEDQWGNKLWLWDRIPHAIKFQAVPGEDDNVKLTDFVLVSLHMKSNVGTTSEVKLKRAHEVKTLMENLEAIKEYFDEEDVVFLGDTNCKNQHEEAIKTFLEHGYEDLNADDISTYYRGDKAPFDRIFVPKGRRAFEYSRQYILRSASPLDHDRYLSDHYLIKTSLVVRKDDD